MKKLLELAESINIAEELDTQKLGMISSRVIDQYNQDWDSMTDWVDLNNKGRELSKPDLNPRTSPWQGAANYKSTAITQAKNAFADRASAELLRDPNLIMMNIIGKDDEKASKKKIADRISEFENFLLNYKMDNWRDDQSDMLYKLAPDGTVFKKVYFDPLERKKVSCLIEFPNFAVGMGNKSLEKCRSFTEIQTFSLNEAREYQNLGYWRMCDLGTGDDMQQGSNAAEGAELNADNAECYYVQNTFLDLDDDGYEEPYVVTLHKGTGEVLRIVADYTAKDIIIRNGQTIISMDEAQSQGDLAFKAIMSKAELMKINRRMDIVKYGFIRGDGFLDVGYYYLLAALTNLTNTTTNQLIDAGTVSNLGGGFLAKEFRKGPNQSGMTAFKPSEWKQTDIPATLLGNAIFPRPVQEPSQTLLALNEMTKAELANFSQSIDLSAMISNNVSPMTAISAISEQEIPRNAIYQYILRSQSKEFELLVGLTQGNYTDKEYQEIVGENNTIEGDYNSGAVIKPTAQKSMSSQVMRNFEINSLMERLPLIQSAGGDSVKIIKTWLEQFKSINVDGILPEMDEQQRDDEVGKQELSKLKQLLGD